MKLALIIAGLVGICVIMAVCLFACAMEGYEDQEGFHLGNKEE